MTEYDAKKVSSIQSFYYLRSSGRDSMAVTLESLSNLTQLKPGWNGEDTDVPSNEAVVSASIFVLVLYLMVAQLGMPWIIPHIAASADGEVVLEWWCNEQKLTFYFSGSVAIEYVYSWGSNTETEMEYGVIEDVHKGELLWKKMVSPN